MTRQRDYAGKAYIEPPAANSWVHWIVCLVCLLVSAAMWLSPLWLPAP